ncbi:hypothetical protein J2W55_004845 [Mucilaginibacter pocheonensis]|uniref:Uncharacterized protein n=1 Tax=Mucilaginibacter pocheonensis TaxID=398050 RepID=A0ABU1THT4_9SPHI|nr:hypothetical protein [Mucilaginibacter pocheonensis]
MFINAVNFLGEAVAFELALVNIYFSTFSTFSLLIFLCQNGF